MATNQNGTGVPCHRKIMGDLRLTAEGCWVPRTTAARLAADAETRELKSNPKTVRRPWEHPDGPLNRAEWVAVPCVSEDYLQSWWPAFAEAEEAKRKSKRKLAFAPGAVEAAVCRSRLKPCYRAAVYEVLAEGQAPRYVAQHYQLSLGSLKVACTRVRQRLSRLSTAA